MQLFHGPLGVIQTDPLSCFVALDNNSVFQDHRIAVKIGRIKNQNKNPIAEKAVQELKLNLLRPDPDRGPMFPVVLSVATVQFILVDYELTIGVPSAISSQTTRFR